MKIFLSVTFRSIDRHTPKTNNINPYNYLKYLLNHIHDYSDPEELVNLLPYNIDKKLLSD